MFPRIAKCIIYHALYHLFRTFKMLLQYLELQIIHVGVINRVEIQQMGFISRRVWAESVWSNYLGYSCLRLYRWEKNGSSNFTSFGNELAPVDPSLQCAALLNEFFGFALWDWVTLTRWGELGHNIWLNWIEVVNIWLLQKVLCKLVHTLHGLGVPIKFT